MKRIAIAALAATAAAFAAPAALKPLPKGVLPDPAGLKINAGSRIPFENMLPRMRCGGKACGAYNNPELGFPGMLSALDHRLGDFLWNMRKTVWADRRLVFVDGRTLTCQLNWIRDHVHQMKGFRHWESDLTSFLDFILDTQRADGQFYELVKQLDDFHWTYVNPDCRILYPEDNQALVRLELEADIEYLMVEGCIQAWRASGDDVWLKKALPRLAKGLEYQTSDPKRWEPKLGLCIRPYTIDTWDFTNDPVSSRNRTIDPNEPMAAMHGDNTGVYRAMVLLSEAYARFGMAEESAKWKSRAEVLKANVIRHLWKGSLFAHQFPLNCEPLDANENRRLSMSDAYALNRGILDDEQARALIGEYVARRGKTKAFAEWFTIDPPYAEGFQKFKPGEYVNGAICPFTAGELAKGAFRHGLEEYGWDIISRVMDLSERDGGRIYFLYHPETGEAQGRGPSAWGAAALLCAVDEGLAGIEDRSCLYRHIGFSPRWTVTPYREGRYLTGYEKSGKKVDVRWIFGEKGIRYRVESPAERIDADILLPAGFGKAAVFVNGARADHEVRERHGKRYVRATVKPAKGVADFEILRCEEGAGK